MKVFWAEGFGDYGCPGTLAINQDPQFSIKFQAEVPSIPCTWEFMAFHAG